MDSSIAGVRRRRGQSMLDTCVLLVVIVAALVAMFRYLQRGYQGYLYANSSVHGAQFHPVEPFKVSRTLQLNQRQDVTIEAGPSSALPSGIPGNESTSGGTLPPREIRVKADVNSNWKVQGNEEYEAR